MNPGVRGGSFFRTMVLMSSSVAVGCGGMTQAPDGSGGTGAGGSPGSGGTGTGTGGNGAGAAGTGAGGNIILGTGGVPDGTGGLGLGGLGGAFPTDCPTTQLSCPENNLTYCSYYGFLTLPGNCECDAARPQSADDCAESEDFVCLGAVDDAQGNPFDPMAGYSCECVPTPADSNCGSRCAAHSLSYSWATCQGPEEDLDAYLCGCAVTILK